MRLNDRRPVLAALVLSILALMAGCGSSEAEAPQATAPAAIDATLAELRGQWLVVNYWAEWCRPCRHEIPELNELDGRDGVQVLGVNFDGLTGEALAELSERMGIAFRVAETDPADALGIEQPQVLPTTWVFDAEGNAVKELVGPQTAESIASVMGI